jgi:3'-5' exoribonuclease
VIKAQGGAVSFRSTVQLSITGVRKVDDSAVDLAEYLPVAKGDIDAMFADLMAFVEQIETPCLRQLLHLFFHDGEVAKLFKKAPAAKGFHHVYIGGLLEHTLSVIRLLDQVTKHYQGINRDLVISGGILHDIGKIYEYTYDRMFDYSDEGRLIGHIVIGLEMLDARIAAVEGFPEQLAMELRHLILSHHGTQEFGSPKRPKTPEALIVHFIDDLDAKVNAFQEFVKESDDDSHWTPFHKLLERFIYKG